MRSRLLTAVAVVGLLVIGLFLVGCGSSDTTGPPSDVPNPLRVGSDIPYPPFETGRTESDYSGFDIELIKAIADDLGVDTQIIDTPFDPIIDNLNSNKFDVIASAMTITPERAKEVTFSRAYFSADQSLVVKSDSDIASADDLAGKTVGGQKGTTGAAYAQDKTDAKTVRTYGTIDDAFNALENGQVDAVVNDFIPSQEAVKAKPDLKIAETFQTGEEYGFAMRQDDTGLVSALNDSFQNVIDDGTFDDLYQKYFHVKPPSSLTSG